MKQKLTILTNNSIGLYVFRKELLSELSKNYTVIASTPDDGLLEELERQGCKILQTKIDRRGINPLKDFKLVFHYYRILKRIQPDLVITYTIKPNIYGGFLCRKMKIPYAVNITGLGSVFQKGGLLKKAVSRMYKYSLKKARTVFFENEENCRVFMQQNLISGKQACVLNGAGVNLGHFKLLPYPEEGAGIRFLFIGRIMKEKGIDELFTAMNRLHAENPTCTLDILGRYEEDYEEKIKEYEKAGWLHYYGYQEDVRPFIGKCHCFVLPSWHEGMANTNLECAASGRPVITSDIPGCKEAVVDGASGFLCKKQDAESLYKVLKKFIALGWEERRQMGLAGRQHMEEVFDKKKVVKETVGRLLLQGE